MVVFDITNAESFAKAKNWVKELQRQGNPNMIMALAGNKADLAAQRSVTADEAKVGSSSVFWNACADMACRTQVHCCLIMSACQLCKRTPRRQIVLVAALPEGSAWVPWHVGELT